MIMFFIAATADGEDPAPLSNEHAEEQTVLDRHARIAEAEKDRRKPAIVSIISALLRSLLVTPPRMRELTTHLEAMTLAGFRPRASSGGAHPWSRAIDRALTDTDQDDNAWSWKEAH
jgi:hypothetical protein